MLSEFCFWLRMHEVIKGELWGLFWNVFWCLAEKGITPLLSTMRRISSGADRILSIQSHRRRILKRTSIEKMTTHGFNLLSVLVLAEYLNPRCTLVFADDERRIRRGLQILAASSISLK